MITQSRFAQRLITLMLMACLDYYYIMLTHNVEVVTLNSSKCHKSIYLLPVETEGNT